MSVDVKRKSVRSRSYLNKDFTGFRADILGYVKTFYPDRVKDFSEAGVGGMFIDMASYVGDVMSFYLDHQFNELNDETAVESKNIERHIRTAGVPITGASPSVVTVEVYIEVQSEQAGSVFRPQNSALPVIMRGTVFKAGNGTQFELTEDLDYTKTSKTGALLSSVSIGDVNSDGSPLSYVMMLPGVCISGASLQQSFSFSSVFSPFRKFVLSQENVTDIISVVDSDGNQYYEVGSLTQDVVFVGILNVSDDKELVKENLEIVPAPYRFVRSVSTQTGLTTIQFGSGNAETLDDDIVPDPSELSLPLYGKTNFTRFSIDPSSILGTRTLGISPTGVTVTVQYRWGGGLSHNVSPRSIRSVSNLKIKFPGNPSTSVASSVRSSIDVTNPDLARGGEPAPSLDDLRQKIPAARNAQSRIVTREDLLARIYTMPSNFGRVFRAGVRSNSNNPLATQVFIISRDSNSRLIVSPDTLKKNLRKYLNQFRLISDAVDILDAHVINYRVEFRVTVDPNANKNSIIQSIISNIGKYLNIKNSQIDKPIMISDVTNIIINETGVISLANLKFTNVFGTIREREYSDISYNLNVNTYKGLIVGSPGSIFELRYPDIDIIGSAS